MNWKWVGRLAFVLVVYYLAENYASATVLSRITEFQETLIAPDGRRYMVSKNAPERAAARPTAASIVAMEGVSFGYRVTYTLPARPRLVCTYRLPGIKCEDGWTVLWSQPIGRR